MRTSFRFTVLTLSVLFLFSACSDDEDATTPQPTGPPVVVIETNYGTIEIETYPEHAPKTVENFATHARNGYYDSVRFHRVVKNFVIQGGDPTGTGEGGESIWGGEFEDEIDTTASIYQGEFNGYTRGTVGMANDGPNTNGSQFFIMHVDYKLPPLYTIFGKVTAGIATVDSIANVPVRGPNRSSPVDDVIMERVYVK